VDAGTYFASEPSLALQYAAEVLDAADAADREACVAVLLCAVLHDELIVGERARFPPPRKPHSPSGALYTATAGGESRPGGERPIIVTYADHQALPLYIVTLDPSAR
jgi:hypothetical protein